MKKDIFNKDIKLKSFIIVIVILMLLEVLIAFVKMRSNEKKIVDMCSSAICNEDDTICFVYDLDENGETIVTWQGSCVGK